MTSRCFFSLLGFALLGGAAQAASNCNESYCEGNAAELINRVEVIGQTVYLHLSGTSRSLACGSAPGAKSVWASGSLRDAVLPTALSAIAMNHPVRIYPLLNKPGSPLKSRCGITMFQLALDYSCPGCS